MRWRPATPVPASRFPKRGYELETPSQEPFSLKKSRRPEWGGRSVVLDRRGARSPVLRDPLRRLEAAPGEGFISSGVGGGRSARRYLVRLAPAACVKGALSLGDSVSSVLSEGRAGPGCPAASCGESGTEEPDLQCGPGSQFPIGLFSHFWEGGC